MTKEKRRTKRNSETMLHGRSTFHSEGNRSRNGALNKKEGGKKKRGGGRGGGRKSMKRKKEKGKRRR